MKRSSKVTGVVCILLALLALGTYGLFHGYFDNGNFEVKEVQRSAGNQVAILAERSDNDALGGLEYFVLTGNHVFSAAELRHAYYSDAVIFATQSGCLKLHWDNSNRLVISCVGFPLAKNQINAQKQQSRNISISYENIPVR